MELVKYTVAEYKELELALNKNENAFDLNVVKVALKGKVTKAKEAKLLEFLTKYKYTTEGKSLYYHDTLVLFEIDDDTEILNENILNTINHNKNELLQYNNRKKEIEEELQYQADSNVELPKLNLSDFKSKQDTHTLSRNLADVVNQAMDYCDYQKEPNKFPHIRPNLFLDVDFQRPIVWNMDMKQRLIMSILKGMPIGNLYYNTINIYSVANETGKDIKELTELDDIVYDGKQRLSAIIDFKLGKFSVKINGLDYYYHNMRNVFERALNTTINVIETKITNKKDLIEFYLDINVNKVEHDENAINHAKNILNSL